MPIQRINEFPDGSGLLTSDDIFLFMDDPSGSEITKKISLSGLTNKINENINLSSYAPLYSPNFSGVPTVPTAPSGTNTSQIANTSFVRGEINNLVDSAPAALDTLNELAAALNDDSNFASSVTNSLAGKASLSGATFTGTISGPSGNFTTLQQNGIGVSVSGHSHSSSDISNFNSSVSGLLPSVSGSGYASTAFSNNVYTISVTGLQPSGDYSVNGHIHVSSNITDFNSTVSGLLPVKSIVGSGNINVSSVSGNFNISSSGLVKSDISGIAGASGVYNIVTISQANYDALASKDPNTIYFII